MGDLQTVQRQHRRKVFAVGDPGGVGHARLPEVGPEGGRRNDRAVDGGHLPVVGGQRGGHQHPARDDQQEGDDLRSRAGHGRREAREAARRGGGPGAQNPSAPPRSASPESEPTEPRRAGDGSPEPSPGRPLACPPSSIPRGLAGRSDGFQPAQPSRRSRCLLLLLLLTEVRHELRRGAAKPLGPLPC